MPGAADSADTHTADGDGRSNHAGTDAGLAGDRCKKCNYQKQKPAGNHSRLNGSAGGKARQAPPTNWCCSFVPDSTPIIHERFCCNRGFATTTSLSAGVLAAQSLDVLFQVRLGLSGLRAQDTAGSPARRRPQTWRSLFFAPWTSPRDFAISRRTVMNNGD